MRRLKQLLFYDRSEFCRVKYAQAGIKRDLPCLAVENIVPFEIRKFENSNRNFWSDGTRPTSVEGNPDFPVGADIDQVTLICDLAISFHGDKTSAATYSKKKINK